MQEVDVTQALLVQFSTEYGRVPIVEMNDAAANLKGIPFSHHILYYWISELANTGNNNMYQVFTAWLCGKDKFVHPDVKGSDIIKVLAETMQPIVEGAS